MIPPESHFFLWLYDKYKDWSKDDCLTNFLEDLFSCTKFETWEINIDDLRDYLNEMQIESYGDLISAIYHFYAISKGKPNITIWGDKNSLWIDKLDVIDQVYHNSLFVHIVRDGRDIACSYRKLNQKELKSKYAPTLPSDVMEIADIWRRNIRGLNIFWKKIGYARVFELRYEDLISNPKLVLKDLFRFLRISFEEDVINYHMDDSKMSIEPETFFKWKEQICQPLNPQNKKLYLKELSMKQKNQFEDIAQKELRKYGYI